MRTRQWWQGRMRTEKKVQFCSMCNEELQGSEDMGEIRMRHQIKKMIKIGRTGSGGRKWEELEKEERKRERETWELEWGGDETKVWLRIATSRENTSIREKSTSPQERKRDINSVEWRHRKEDEEDAEAEAERRDSIRLISKWAPPCWMKRRATSGWL